MVLIGPLKKSSMVRLDGEIRSRLAFVEFVVMSEAAVAFSFYSLTFDANLNVHACDAQDHFRSSGEVERADVMMDSSRRSKGWGVVRFRTPVSLPQNGDKSTETRSTCQLTSLMPADIQKIVTLLLLFSRVSDHSFCLASFAVWGGSAKLKNLFPIPFSGTPRSSFWCS